MDPTSFVVVFNRRSFSDFFSPPQLAAYLDISCRSQILSGNTSGVIQRLEALAQKEEIPSSQRQALKTTIGYFRRNLLRMRYDQYLARGLPIGTGVIEGACCHLVKDRMEHSGMQWSKLGAQGILDLRAVRINGDWDDYQGFHRQQQHRRLYDPNSSVPSFTEKIVLEKAT